MSQQILEAVDQGLRVDYFTNLSLYQAQRHESCLDANKSTQCVDSLPLPSDCPFQLSLKNQNKWSKLLSSTTNLDTNPNIHSPQIPRNLKDQPKPTSTSLTKKKEAKNSSYSISFFTYPTNFQQYTTSPCT